MGWSTRELAELADTTLRAVRHYHQVGLLPQPERHANGYKQYGVEHLVRLLRIRRLVDLRMSLEQIRALDDRLEPSSEELAEVDAQVRATIARLEGVLGDLERMRTESSRGDLPRQLAFVLEDATVTAADRQLLVVLGRVVQPQQLQAVADQMRTRPAGPEALEFDRLPADADETRRRSLAERMLPESIACRLLWPDLPEIAGTSATARAVRPTVEEVYNVAQVDVLDRLARLRAGRAAPRRARPSRPAGTGGEDVPRGRGLSSHVGRQTPSTTASGPSRPRP